MGKGKKAKNAALPQYRRNFKAAAAAGAAATRGRARTFADKKDKLAGMSADPEISEGMDEYTEKKKSLYIAEYELCGQCEHYHPPGWAGDCRDDSKRFTQEDLDKKHGEDGWKVIEEEELSLTVTVKGSSDTEIEAGLEKVLELVRAGNVCGSGGMKNTFSFDIKGKKL